MNTLLELYKEAPWFAYTPGPSEETITITIPELAKALEGVVLAPGIQLDFLDDTVPQGVTLDTFNIGENTLYKYVKDGEESDCLIYYIHGGGFIMGNGAYTRANAIRLLQRIGLPVFATEYRLAPQNRYPDALDDVYASYLHITQTLNHVPSKIYIVCDSAGGDLSFALMHRLRAEHIETPAGIVAYSPIVDLNCTAPSHTENAATDFILPTPIGPGCTLYANPDEMNDPYVSPIFGDFTGFPPVYLCATDAEMLLCDTLNLATRLHKQGVNVKAHIFGGLWHDWPFMHVNNFPEADIVFKESKELMGIS